MATMSAKRGRDPEAAVAFGPGARALLAQLAEFFRPVAGVLDRFMIEPDGAGLAATGRFAVGHRSLRQDVLIAPSGQLRTAIRTASSNCGRDILVEQIGVAVLVVEVEQLGAGEGTHRVALTDIGIDPDPHQLGTSSAMARSCRPCLQGGG